MNMGVEITWNGQPLNVGTIEIDADIPESDIDFSSINRGVSGEMTLTLDDRYFKAHILARMLDANSPKKAKRIRNMVEHLNPLRIMGLL